MGRVEHSLRDGRGRAGWSRRFGDVTCIIVVRLVGEHGVHVAHRQLASKLWRGIVSCVEELRW